MTSGEESAELGLEVEGGITFDKTPGLLIIVLEL